MGAPATPAEAWDYDGVNENVLADITIDGQKTPVMMKADRDGFFFVVNRDTGKLISAKPFVPVNWAKGYDEETGRPVEDPAKRPRLDYKATDICPSWMGGKNWQPMSFNPGTGLIYVTTNNMCQDMKGAEVNYRRGAFYLGNDFSVNPGHGDHLGQLLALDPATQKPAWTMDLPLPWNGGTMTTAGNLVFFGDINGMFHALDAKTGKPLWEMNVGSGVGRGTDDLLGRRQAVCRHSGWARRVASGFHGRGRQEDLRGDTGRRNAVRVLAVVTRLDLKARRWSIAAGLLCSMVAGLPLIQPAHAQEEAAPFRLCADPDNLPFSSTSEATPGFYIELGRDIAQALRRPFQPVWVPTYNTKRQVRLKMLAGQCDGFAGVPDDASFMGPRLIFSRPIVQLGYALVAPAVRWASAALRTFVAGASRCSGLHRRRTFWPARTMCRRSRCSRRRRRCRTCGQQGRCGVHLGCDRRLVEHHRHARRLRFVPVNGTTCNGAPHRVSPRPDRSARRRRPRPHWAWYLDQHARGQIWFSRRYTGIAANVAEATTRRRNTTGTSASRGVRTPKTSRPARNSSTRTALTVTDRTPFKASSAATYGCCGSVTATKCPRRSYSL